MPQRIDVPGMGIVEFPDGMSDDDIVSAIHRNKPGGERQGPPDERGFMQRLGSKLSNFAQNVYENPPPTVAAIRDTIKDAPASARELTWGADPQAAERAAGTALGAAGLGMAGARALQFPAHATKITVPAPPGYANEALQAAGRLGVDIPKYIATESNAVPQFAAGLKNMSVAGEPLIRSANRLSEQMGGARDAIGMASPELAGERAGQALAGWVKTGSKEPVSAAYKTVDDLIDPTVRAPLVNTREVMRQIDAERANSLIPASKAADMVRQAALNDAGMDYAGTKGLRTFMGEKTPQELAVSGISPTEHKRLYAALSKDLGNVVREAGGDAALQAWQEANAVARLTRAQQNAISKIIGSKGDAAPEAIFSRLERYAGSKSTADINRLRLAKQAMGPAAWEEVGSAMISRMGSAPDGTFSPDRFVTAFGNMSPKAKGEIFSAQQRGALEDLFAVSKFARDRISRFSNPSGTARALFSGGMLTGAMADPISTIGAVVGGRLVAEALSRPAVVRAATAVSRARDPAAARIAQTRLLQIAGREGLVTRNAPPQLEYRP